MTARRRRPVRAWAIRTFYIGLAVLFQGLPARSDPVTDFYHGRTLSLVIGTTAGNDYDFRGRLLARFLPRHIPGEPAVVPRNMPGAGGIQAANWLASVAPRDGSVLHMIMQNMMSAQAMKLQGVEFDTRKFSWIGNTTTSPNVVNTWHTTGVTSVDQIRAREVILGAPSGTVGVIYANAMTSLLGSKIKLVTGYPGGNEANLAMERGEIDGRASNSWASWKSTQPAWVSEKKLNMLVQVGLKRAPDLPDVPLLLELASNDKDRKVLSFLSADTTIARALVVGPDVPVERIAALRRAFDETVRDPEFLAEADKTKMDISPLSGEESQKIADSIVDADADIVMGARAIVDIVAQ